MEEELNLLRQKREEYLSGLGEIFHYKGALDLAKLSFNQKYRYFVEDYINLVCIPEFREKYQKERSLLEQQAQLALR